MKRSKIFPTIVGSIGKKFMEWNLQSKGAGDKLLWQETINKGADGTSAFLFQPKQRRFPLFA